MAYSFGIIKIKKTQADFNLVKKEILLIEFYGRHILLLIGDKIAVFYWIIDDHDNPLKKFGVLLLHLHDSVYFLIWPRTTRILPNSILILLLIAHVENFPEISGYFFYQFKPFDFVCTVNYNYRTSIESSLRVYRIQVYLKICYSSFLFIITANSYFNKKFQVNHGSMSLISTPPLIGIKKVTKS